MDEVLKTQKEMEPDRRPDTNKSDKMEECEDGLIRSDNPRSDNAICNTHKDDEDGENENIIVKNNKTDATLKHNELNNKSELLPKDGKEITEVPLPKISLGPVSRKGNNSSELPAQTEKIAVLEFDWMAYIEAINKKMMVEPNELSLESVKSHLFGHVEASLDGGVREGMIVEIPYQDISGTKHAVSNHQYWLAKVDAVYGPLLKLSYVGYKEERKKPEIWHDLTQKRIFPLGTN